MTNSLSPDFSKRYEFCGLMLDPAQRVLRGTEGEVSIERRVMDLLLFLIENRNRVVTKEEIQDNVWPGTIVTETALTRAIMKARRAVADSAEEQGVIRTIHGEGYRFVADVRVVSSEEEKAIPSRMGTQAIAGVIGALAVAIAFTILLVAPEGTEPVATAEDETQLPGPVLAVLPFENLSPDPAHAYFASGIHEEVLNEVARGTSLPVVARTSVAQYAGTTKTIPAIAAELGVTAILEGSVRYTENRVRITAQLIDGSSGVHLWSESYDRDFADIFDIQSDIANEIARALEVEILGNSARVSGSPQSVLAYKEYLLARNLRYRTFEVGWDPVLEHVNKALAYDASFIPALSILHNAYQNRIIGQSHEDANAQMLAITQRAVRRDPNHAITLSLRAKDAAYQWRWDESTRLWDEALKRDPGDPDNLGTAAFFNIGAGDYDRAREIVDQGVRLNPLHDWSYYADMLLRIAERDQEGFVETGKLVISMGGNRAFPAAFTLVLHSAEAGDEEAVGHYGDTVVRMTGGNLSGVVGVLQEHARGKRLSSETVTTMLTRSPPPNTYKWMGVQTYLMAGDLDSAFRVLDDIVESRAVFSVLRVVSDPAFETLWNDPRFDDFLRRTGLQSRRT